MDFLAKIEAIEDGVAKLVNGFQTGLSLAQLLKRRQKLELLQPSPRSLPEPALDFLFRRSPPQREHLPRYERGARVKKQAHGGLAQLVERVLCKHEVSGSNPLSSTSQTVLRYPDGQSSDGVLFQLISPTASCLRHEVV